MSGTFPRYVSLGDSALTIVVGEGISRELSGKVLRISDVLRAASVKGIREIVPSYASLGIFCDSALVGMNEILAHIRPLVDAASGEPGESKAESPRIIRIPVRYDGEDLGEVADRTGHAVEQVIDLHAEREYYVFVIGFVPGFAYLGEIEKSLVLPRRSAPRKRVPPGSVAIAEAQTGIYPFATPGGWHLIGSTDARMFDASRAEPSLLRVGDRVIFEPVT